MRNMSFYIRIEETDMIWKENVIIDIIFTFYFNSINYHYHQLNINELEVSVVSVAIEIIISANGI